MGGTLETLITILNNSKQINELPSLPSVEAGDLIGVYNLANDRLEKFNLIKLSDKSFTYSINSISQSVGTSVIIGKLNLEYSGEKVTKILFDSVFSEYLQGFNALLSQFTYTIKLFNITQKTVHIAEIATINNVGALNELFFNFTNFFNGNYFPIAISPAVVRKIHHICNLVCAQSHWWHVFVVLNPIDRYFPL